MATAELGLQTGDLPSQLVPETHGAQIPDSLLRPKKSIVDPISGLIPTNLVSLRVAAMSDTDLDAAIGPVINEAPTTQPALNTEKARRETLNGWKKRIAFAGGAVGFAGTMFATPALAGGERMIAIPGAGDTGKSAAEIYCTPEYLASNPQLIAGGDSNVGGEPTSQTQTDIAEAAGSDTALAIQQPETGEQRVIVNFTDQDGRALSVLLPVCPPEGETTGNINDPEIDDELFPYINVDENGDYKKVPINEKFTSWNDYASLNIMPANEQDLYGIADAYFQGCGVNYEIVRLSDGKEHLIINMLQELPYGKGKQYFVPVDAGVLGDKKNFAFRENNTLPPAGGFEEVSTSYIKDLLDKNGDMVIGFGINSGNIPEKVLPKKYDKWVADVNSRREVQTAYIQFAYENVIKHPTDEAEIPAELQGMINTRVTEGADTTKILKMTSFVVKK